MRQTQGKYSIAAGYFGIGEPRPAEARAASASACLHCPLRQRIGVDGRDARIKSGDGHDSGL
jgi:hypothetical protein